MMQFCVKRISPSVKNKSIRASIRVTEGYITRCAEYCRRHGGINVQHTLGIPGKVVEHADHGYIRVWML